MRRTSDYPNSIVGV